MGTYRNALIAGFTTVANGVNSGVATSLVPAGQLAWSINTQYDSGYACCRYGFNKIALDYGGDAILQSRVEEGRFQVSGYYDPANGDPCLIASISGRQFRFNVSRFNTVQEITQVSSTVTTTGIVAPVIGGTTSVTVTSSALISNDSQIKIGAYYFTVIGIAGNVLTIRNDTAPTATVINAGATVLAWQPNPSRPQKNWFVQAENYALISDGESQTLVYDGATMGRLDPALKGIPPCTVMTYGMGRIWYALPDRRRFGAGDLVYSVTGSTADILKVTENTFLNGGGYFTTPSNSGNINAMRFTANLDTSLGQGPLQVFTDNMIFSVNAPVDRTVWQSLTYPIQTISQINFGATSQESAVAVNGDIWYRAPDGIRSFILARRDFNSSWSNTAQSHEVKRILNTDTKELLKFASGINFGNRLIMTCAPSPRDRGTIHQALVAIDFDPVSGITSKETPIFDGIYTGLNVLQLVKGNFFGKERAFAFVLNAEAKIELYELIESARFDSVDQGVTDSRISWIVETGALYTQAQGAQFNLKQLQDGEVWLDRVSGIVDVLVKYRPLGSSCWVEWKSFQVCATYKDCEPGEDGCLNFWTELKEQPRRRQGFGKPPSGVCDEGTGEPADLADDFEIRLEITGFCRIRQLRIICTPKQEPMSGVVCT